MVFHVLNRGVGRRLLFTKDEDFLAFERVVEETLRTRRMRLCAYCLMPNHWHFVVWPEWDGDLPAFMQQVTNTHVKRWKEHRHEIGYGHLYQGRYKCFPVETEDYFYQVVRYMERNALRANLVEQRNRGVGRVCAVWSAKTRRSPSSRRGLCVAPPIGCNLSTNRKRKRVEAVRCCVNRGRPFGDPNWVTDTAERLGLNGRFGLVEDRRNNHKACHSYLYSPDLVAVTFHTHPVTFHTHPVTFHTHPVTFHTQGLRITIANPG